MNEKIEKTLKLYSEKLGIPIKELKQRFEIIKKQEKPIKGVEISEAVLDKRAITVLRGDLRREAGTLSRRGKTWIGFIFGDTDVMDFVAIMRNKAEYWYKNPNRRAEAISKHMITGDGKTVLDTREQIGWIINPDYGKPLTGHSYYRALYGIFGLANEHTDFKFRKIHFNGDLSLDVDVQPYRTCIFRATERKSKKEGKFELNATPYTKLQYTDEELDYDTLVKECDEPIYQLGELENLLTLTGGSKEYPLLIEADVPIINYEVRENQSSRVLTLDDETLDIREEGGITCFIQKHFPLDFGKDSRVIVVGSLAKDNRDDLIINAIGCYPLKDMHRANK